LDGVRARWADEGVFLVDECGFLFDWGEEKEESALGFLFEGGDENEG